MQRSPMDPLEPPARCTPAVARDPRRRVPPIRFWLPLLLVAGTIRLAPLFHRAQPPLQSHALALLLCGSVALCGYLFTVITHPERF